MRCCFLDDFASILLGHLPPDTGASGPRRYFFRGSFVCRNSCFGDFSYFGSISVPRIFTCRYGGSPKNSNFSGLHYLETNMAPNFVFLHDCFQLHRMMTEFLGICLFQFFDFVCSGFQMSFLMLNHRAFGRCFSYNLLFTYSQTKYRALPPDAVYCALWSGSLS